MYVLWIRIDVNLLGSRVSNLQTMFSNLNVLVLEFTVSKKIRVVLGLCILGLIFYQFIDS